MGTPALPPRPTHRSHPTITLTPNSHTFPSFPPTSPFCFPPQFPSPFSFLPYPQFYSPSLPFPFSPPQLPNPPQHPLVPKAPSPTAAPLPSPTLFTKPSSLNVPPSSSYHGESKVSVRIDAKLFSFSFDSGQSDSYAIHESHRNVKSSIWVGHKGIEWILSCFADICTGFQGRISSVRDSGKIIS